MLKTYDFSPSISDFDLYLFGSGVHYELYKVLGAHRICHQGIWGVRFAVFAPSASGCRLIADFNHWNGAASPMRSLGNSGVWELFVPGIEMGEKYKFEILTADGRTLVKTDPFANQMELRSRTASIVTEFEHFPWSDSEWMAERLKNSPKWQERPLNIYELHADSWRKPYGHTLTYRELAPEIVSYCKDLGYTHVEFLPLEEHPLDESWGYQVTGYFAPTSRFGSVADFQWMINYLHVHQIGVILDWVPGHFPSDDFSLTRFDGTALFEHEDPRQGFHPHWQTQIFNLSRYEISNFLIASALFWLKEMHIDGLRVDAVASMLYLDYGRNPGEWIPNQYGGNENLSAIEFFKHANSIIKQRHPDILLIAEESTAFPKVTAPPEEGGLGFDLKWNMGWMNDTLRFFGKDPIYRQYHDKDLTFGLLYIYSERYCLALSHDEAVHGKGSFLNKMPGDLWQKFANLRLLLSYQICQPGKKLLFMGAEIGVWHEWNCKSELEWGLLGHAHNRSLQQMVKELNHLYLSSPPLYERDFDPSGFGWIGFDDKHNCVFAYMRKSASREFLCIHHFSPNYCENYFLRLPHIASIAELFNSDAERYGGSGKINSSPKITNEGLIFQLSPLSTLIFDVTFK